MTTHYSQPEPLNEIELNEKRFKLEKCYFEKDQNRTAEVVDEYFYSIVWIELLEFDQAAIDAVMRTAGAPFAVL